MEGVLKMQRKLCTRKIDELGRIVLPLEARNILNIKEKQSLDVFVDEDAILIKPNNDIPTCSLCGESDMKLIEVSNSLICYDCVARIKEN